MPPSKSLASKPRWYLIPMRVLLVTSLLTLLSFAVSLLLGILGLVIAARLRGFHPNMTTAYRHIALPAAAVVGAIVLISASAMEVRHYRQTKALAEIERISC
jgi:ABC-type cobalamin transport system permease subunit